MEWSKSTTPQKPFGKNHQSSPVLNFLKRSANTPKTPIITRRSNLGVIPIHRTPDNSRNLKSRIRNPFEASLPERYQLPTICSPSMFQRPLTPQHCSTQFEWTIDEVSSLGPANLEPHETQFIESPDPELEARAQAAISSFFKEQKIVPSPFVENNIMSSTAAERTTDSQSIHFQAQRVILAHISGNTPVSKPGRRIRDSSSQTVLSFPPILPPEIEEILKPFFSYQENQQQKLDYEDNSADYEARDALLRRKLFDMNEFQEIEEPVIYEYDHFSPPPKSPELDSRPFQDSLDKSSFGSLSPISKLDKTGSPLKESPCESNSAITHDVSNGKRKSSLLNSSFADDKETPNQSTRHHRKFKNISGSFRNSPNDGFSSEGTPGTVVNGSLYRSTPGFLQTRRSSSPCFDMSIDRSVNRKISQLVMNSAKRPKAEITDLFREDDETEDEEMQLSQFSTSLESPTRTKNAEHTDTPRGSQQKRRVRAKNLSQSFTLHSEDEEYEKVDKENINYRALNPSTSTSTFYRTDSGFNELTQSSTASTQEIVDYDKLNIIPNMDQSMTLVSKLV